MRGRSVLIYVAALLMPRLLTYYQSREVSSVIIQIYFSLQQSIAVVSCSTTIAMGESLESREDVIEISLVTHNLCEDQLCNNLHSRRGPVVELSYLCRDQLLCSVGPVVTATLYLGGGGGSNCEFSSCPRRDLLLPVETVAKLRKLLELLSALYL